jgi:hypothetical protein
MIYRNCTSDQGSAGELANQAETGYDLTRFPINWEAQTVTCPEGKASSSWTPVQDAGKSLMKVKFSQHERFCGRDDAPPEALSESQSKRIASETMVFA